MKQQKIYDVIILGGGLAGGTLALQLKNAKTDLSILVLEKRNHNAPTAGHKVGESISELGSHYLRNVLNLKGYLEEHQLPKYGFRFFFSHAQNENIAERVEFGSKIDDPIPAHQIDRGLFENDLTTILKNKGVEIILGAPVKQVELENDGHQIVFEKNETTFEITGKWVIDSTGRRGFLRRKLNLDKKIDHQINAVWFRINHKINIDDWSDNSKWKSQLDEGRRQLATNHLMGKGYWIWIISLASNCTSFGIVTDPTIHSFEQINTFEKALKWIKLHEPLAEEKILIHKNKIIDFKVMKNLAQHTKRFYSTERWGLTGDAGVFMDPFYSPGIDFIGLNNSWLTELIIRDINKEDISLHKLIYEHAQNELINGWLKLYKNMYQVFGNTQVMLMKIAWDWATYWGIPTLIFKNNGYINITFLKNYSSRKNSIGNRFSKLNEKMQALFLAWNEFENESFSNHHLNVFDLEVLYKFHRGLDKKYDSHELINKIESNLEVLELLAAEIFRLASSQVNETPLEMNVNPYTMNLNDKKEVLLEKSSLGDAQPVDKSIQSDLKKIWLVKKKTIANDFI